MLFLNQKLGIGLMNVHFISIFVFLLKFGAYCVNVEIRPVAISLAFSLGLNANLVFCVMGNTQIFPNALFNEASIEDFIEDDIFFEIIHPKELQYTYRLHQARNFGASFQRSYNGVRMVVSDPAECCSYPSNAHLLKGAVALVSRGDCSFLSKAVKAERAGAIAIIVTDNNIENDDIYIKMIDDSTNRRANIPAAFLLGISGHMIQRKLEERKEDAAIINIPVNLSSVPIHKLNQPPWLIW